MSAMAVSKPNTSVAPVLQLAGIGKEFGAIRALHDIDLSIPAGEVVGLMGDNGAGKSTLVKIIAGNFHPTHGSIAFEGREHRFDRPLDARAAGIEVVYQDLALADNVSAAPHVFLGRELRGRWRCSASSSPKPGPGTSSNPCRAGSAKPWRSPARGSPTPS